MWSIVAVACTIVGLFGAYTAIQKGRHPFEGFLFGAILGPFGVITIALLPEGRQVGLGPGKLSGRDDVPRDLPWLQNPEMIAPD